MVLGEGALLGQVASGLVKGGQGNLGKGINFIPYIIILIILQ